MRQARRITATDASRASAGAKKTAGRSGIESVLQHLRRPEGQHAARADLDLLACLRVAADAGLLVAHDEVAKARQLDLLAFLKRVLDGVEHHLDDLGALLLGEPDLLAHALDHVGLGHEPTIVEPTRPSQSNGLSWAAAVLRSPSLAHILRLRPCPVGYAGHP